MPDSPVNEGYNLLGYFARVAAPDPRVQPSIRALLKGFGPCPVAAGASLPTYEVASAAKGWRVLRNGMSLQLAPSVDGALGLLDWHLVNAALKHRSDLLHLHAAAVADPAGFGAMLLVGQSHAGKTTLTLALSMGGFLPFNDDATLVDPLTLHVQPFRRAFHVSDSARALLLDHFAHPIDADPVVPDGYAFPIRWAKVPLPVRWILLVNFRDKASPELVPITGAEATAAILSGSANLQTSPQLALSTCAQLTQRAACYRFTAGDLVASIDALCTLVAAQQPRS